MTIEHDAPRITHIIHELKRRKVTVQSTVRLTPHMLRIVLEGEALEGFTSPSASDHIKIFIPDGSGGLTMRDYTPRHYHPQNRTLTVDFALHEAGPVTQWALNARPGDPVEIGGPRGSQIIDGPVRAWLLIGDETALPSIGRRIEETTAGMPVTSVIAVPGIEDEQAFETRAVLTTHWIHRKDPADAVVYIEKLKHLSIEPGTFIWMAAEGSVVKAVRNYLLQERHHPSAWMKAAGYWVKGRADSKEKFE